MNAWHDSVTYAARERMNRYRKEADTARSLKDPTRARGGLARWREGAATALHKLADALAPQAEAGPSGRMPQRLGAGGRPLG